MAQSRPTLLSSDNHGCIALLSLREQVVAKTAVFNFVPSAAMAADVLTRKQWRRQDVRVDTLQSSLSGSVDSVDRQPRLQ